MDLRRLQSVLPGAQVRPDAERVQNRGRQPGEFAKVLESAQQQAQKLHFSAHALERMAQRGIELTPRELEKIESAVNTAANKGSRSSLVLLEERAFVISVANRTVITALDGDALKDQVVTQIDSAVIL